MNDAKPTVEPELKTVPDDFIEAQIDISNFDHNPENRKKAENELRSGKFYCYHSGWNFHGLIWFEDGKFYELIKRYLCHVATLEGDTLESVYEQACERWGYD